MEEDESSGEEDHHEDGDDDDDDIIGLDGQLEEGAENFTFEFKDLSEDFRGDIATTQPAVRAACRAHLRAVRSAHRAYSVRWRRRRSSKWASGTAS